MLTTKNLNPPSLVQKAEKCSLSFWKYKRASQALGLFYCEPTFSPVFESRLILPPDKNAFMRNDFSWLQIILSLPRECQFRGRQGEWNEVFKVQTFSLPLSLSIAPILTHIHTYSLFLPHTLIGMYALTPYSNLRIPTPQTHTLAHTQGHNFIVICDIVRKLRKIS